ncbi:Integrase [Klebsiella pneumoniae]|nr:Integrase [Klebsiella pneumoniae]
MKLTARQVETAKPKEKPYKLADGGCWLIPMVKDTGVSNTVR